LRNLNALSNDGKSKARINFCELGPSGTFRHLEKLDSKA